MAEELEELLVTDIEIGIGSVDFGGDGAEVVEEDVVIEEVTASDARTGEQRTIRLVYGAQGVPAVADALRAAAEEATAAQ